MKGRDNTMENSRPMPVNLSVLYGDTRLWWPGLGSVYYALDVWGLRRDQASHMRSCLDYVLNKVDTNCTVYYTSSLHSGLILVDTRLEFPLMPLFCWSSLISLGRWCHTSPLSDLVRQQTGWAGADGLTAHLDAVFESELVSHISHVGISTYVSTSFEFKTFFSPFQWVSVDHTLRVVELVSSRL